MATLAVTSEGSPIVKFGIHADEGGLITNKISMSRKVEKKELRGRKGGYKALVSYNNTYEITIDGALPSTGAPSAFAVGESHSMNAANLTPYMDIPSGVQMVIEEVNVEYKNDDFATCSIKMFGYDRITSAAQPVTP